MEAKGERFDKDKIQDRLNRAFRKDPSGREKGEVNDFISFIDQYISAKKSKNITVEKLQHVRKSLLLHFGLVSKKRMLEYELLSNREKGRTSLAAERKLSFEEINLKFIERFRDKLYEAQYTSGEGANEACQHYKINYIHKQIKGLKQLILAAIEAGYVKYFTWSSLTSEYREVDSVYTDFEEIQSIHDTLLTDEAERLVRDKYVLNCFLGLRYGDLNRLEPHLFRKKSIAGNEYVIYCGRTQKTDQKIEFALHPTAIDILESYDFNMPKISALDFNRIIKDVARKAGLTNPERIREIRGTETFVKDVAKYQLMTSHAGRRSFCTNFYNEGVSIQAIMSISGHTTEKEFRKYIKKASVRLDVVAQQVFAIQGVKTLKVAG